MRAEGLSGYFWLKKKHILGKHLGTKGQPLGHILIVLTYNSYGKFFLGVQFILPYGFNSAFFSLNIQFLYPSKEALHCPFEECFPLAILYYLIFMICATPCIVSFDKYFKTHQGAALLWFICQQPTQEQFSKPLNTLCKRAKTHCHNILFQLPCVHKNHALEWLTCMRANIFSIASIFHGKLDI